MVFQDWINLLREMVLKLPNVENLNALKVLCDEDTETDFFNNIVHLQVRFYATPLGYKHVYLPFCKKG